MTKFSPSCLVSIYHLAPPDLVRKLRPTWILKCKVIEAIGSSGSMMVRGGI